MLIQRLGAGNVWPKHRVGRMGRGRRIGADTRRAKGSAKRRPHRQPRASASIARIERTDHALTGPSCELIRGEGMGVRPSRQHCALVEGTDVDAPDGRLDRAVAAAKQGVGASHPRTRPHTPQNRPDGRRLQPIRAPRMRRGCVLQHSVRRREPTEDCLCYDDGYRPHRARGNHLASRCLAFEKK